MQLAQYLDQYVIGQDSAKKVLSVAYVVWFYKVPALGTYITNNFTASSTTTIAYGQISLEYMKVENF